MDDQPTPIKGYRTLTPREIALVNVIKTQGELLGALVAELRSYPASKTGPDGAVVPRIDGDKPSLDQRWISIGATHLQEGLMALTRGVAQPTTF